MHVSAVTYQPLRRHDRENDLILNPNRAAASLDLPVLSNQETIQCFLRMVSYYSNFVSSIRLLNVPLDKLSKRRYQAILKCRRKPKSWPVVRWHYNPQLPIIVPIDDCNNQKDAIFHTNFPKSVRKRCHVLCALTGVEKNYSQIKKKDWHYLSPSKSFTKYLVDAGLQRAPITDRY